MKFQDLQENGYTSSGDIASTYGGASDRTRMIRRNIRGGENDWHQSIADDKAGVVRRDPAQLSTEQREKLRAAKDKIRKQNSVLGKLSDFIRRKQLSQFRISESFDMDDVVSKLKSMERGAGEDSTVSFGVEDDNGNLMKITVRQDQAEEFEAKLATELSDALRRKEVTGNNNGISMAELLYNLNDEFDILDVQFPQIPTDGVYNADKVSYNTPDTASEEVGGPDEEFGGDFPAEFDDAAGGEAPPMDDLGGMEGGEGGEMGGDLGGMEGGEGGEDELGLDEEPPLADDEGVEDFVDEPEATDASPESLLQAVLNMLRADADAKKAEADARAEEARAKQAEWTATAAKNSVEQQEEFVRMEAEMEEQKRREKEAKKMADLARYRVNRASSTGTFGESAKPTFTQFLDLLLEDEFDTIQSLQKQKMLLRQKFQPSPQDDEATRQYKRESGIHAMREINAKIQRVQAAEKYKKTMERQGKKTDQNQQQGQQQNQPNQPNQPNQQQGQQQNQPNQQGQQNNAVQ